MIPVHIIGLGMSPADLTPKALAMINAAEVLAGGRRLLEYFPAHRGEKIVVAKDLAGSLKMIQGAAGKKQVVVLASGDPNYYGIGRRLTEFLGPDNVVLHSNITAVQSACALLKISWDDAVVVSLHGRGLDKLIQVLGAPKIIIYTAGAETPKEIARLLQQPEMPVYRMCVLENLGEADQRVSWLNPPEATPLTFAALNMVVLLGEPPEHSTELHLGFPETAFVHESGLITKSEVRAVVLAKLHLGPGQVLWDVGAGCGSVGLEASLLLPGGQVFAIEQQPQRAGQIMANKSRFGVHNLAVVTGAAPACLADLPQPDRVFIGGGGSKIQQILEAVLAQVQPRGRVVITAALLRTLQDAGDILQARRWEVEICQVQVSRSRDLGSSVYLQALNPVWIIAASPQEKIV
jgi:precorrin-6B C5,15-methyltransferase / cobalt-precorrin-6B C5,C15-methyltransferase